MSNSPITFCLGCCNNLNYLKLAVHSVRKYSYYKDAPFIIFAENCTDGTNEWLSENKEKYNLDYFIETNSEEKTKGIGGSMNETAKKVKTEYIMFLHADFFVAENWDLNALKLFEKYPNIPMWVFSQRFQPNIWSENRRAGTEVFPLEQFGYKHNNFDEQYFIDYAKEFSILNPDREVEKGEGVSGLIRKKDWDYIGGNDPRFAPAFWEDTDIFIRMQLAGYKFVLTSNSVVFHFGSRSATSNFPDDWLIDASILKKVTANIMPNRSEKSKGYEQRGAQRFFEKWGFMPTWTENQFVTYPSNIDKEKYQHLIRL